MKKNNFLNRIVIISVAIYFIVLVFYMICSYFVHTQGLEFRSNISELRIFWVYKLPFILIALILITMYVNWRKKQIKLSKMKFANIIGAVGCIAYGLITYLLIICLIFSGAWDVEREELLDTGYLKVQDKFFPRPSYYYCIPVNTYLREPLTTSSDTINEQYETIEN